MKVSHLRECGVSAISFHGVCSNTDDIIAGKFRFG